MFKNLSIRIKLLLLLLSFTLMTLVLLWVTDYFHTQKKKVNALTEEINEIEILLLQAIRSQNDYLIHETINPEYFESRQSVYLNRLAELNQEIVSRLEDLSENPIIQKMHLDADLVRLISEYKDIQSDFRQLTQTIFQRGFKNYGLEGQMREHAHIIEDKYIEFIDRADLLMLRRHEKDFIIRKEEKYILKFEIQCEFIENQLKINKKVPDEIKSEIMEQLTAYKKSFLDLSSADRYIGLKENSGLKAHVDAGAKKFTLSVDEISGNIEAAKTDFIGQLQASYGLAVLVFLLLSIFGSFKLSSMMTARIKALNNSLNTFVQSNFKKISKPKKELGNDEVGKLAKNFKVMEEEIAIHFENYRTNSERKTAEILNQKQELEDKQGIIEKKNKDILDSIKYAKKIQDSILPNARFMDQLLGEYFVIYKPKDIVSGDFYWIERKDNKVVLAVADCTGHGVPGAFMSIMGNNFLNQAVNEKNITSPELILNYLNVAISSSLGQEKRMNGNANHFTKIQDGMDIAVITIDYASNSLCFSGAQRPVVIVRESELIELKGDRFPVGGGGHRMKNKFSVQELDLCSGDSIFMFSDGYADQFGGCDNKKFKYSKLRELLFSLRKDACSTQKTILSEVYDQWKGEHEQVDDVCMIGIKI